MRRIDPSVVTRALCRVAEEMLFSLTSSAVERMTRYYDDPVAFAREVMGIEPWEGQIRILEAVAKHDRVLVRSGHKIGKSTCAVIIACWFIATRHRARALITAPTAEQIKRIIWRELGLHYPRIASALEGAPELPLDPRTGVSFSGDREIFGRAARTQEGAAGISGPEMVFILDEATGIPDAQYEALKGNTAGRAKFIGFSNPTRPAGWFFDGFQNGLWHCIAISSEESPNVQRELEVRRERAKDPDAPMAPKGEQAEDRKFIPGLARLDYIEEQRRECGVNYRRHPIYQVRVLGEFPSSGPNAIVSMGGVTAARARWDAFVAANLAAGRAMDHGIWGPLELGIDPARYGDDDAVIQPRRGRFAYMPVVMSGRIEGRDIAEAAVQCVRELRKPRMDAGAVVVKIDPLGRAGADTVAALRHHEAVRSGEIALVEVDVNEAADDEERYSDLRTQVWYAGADWIGGDDDEEGKQGVTMLPPVPRLTEELLKATYKLDARGRQLAQSKDKMRETLGRSPDHADAFNLAVYTPPSTRLKVDTGKDLDQGTRTEPRRWSY